nr:PstS family phosphate ABC transporter substrate-binding protein [Sulfuritortus calidifontis]
MTVMAGVLAGALLAPVAHAGLVKVDGSSTVFPITEAVAEEFQKSVKSKTKVTVGISGTGGGFKKFCRGETDISDASRPILKKEMEDCKKAGIEYIELPVAFDALTVIINPKNTWAGELTVAELKKMYEPSAQGKVNNWNQIRAGFPNAPLKLAGAGADSGTFDYFTEAVVGKAKSSRGDYMATEDDNVTIQFVSRDPNAIGYLGLAYYVENKDKVKAVGIKVDDKSPTVLPSLETVNKGTYQPLSRPIFIYINRKSADNPEVAAFVEYYMKHGAKLSKEVGYVDLPAKAYTMALDNFKRRKTGTAFGGEAEVGVSVEELLQREGKH